MTIASQPTGNLFRRRLMADRIEFRAAEMVIDMTEAVAICAERDRAFEVYFSSLKEPPEMREKLWLAWSTAIAWNERRCW